MRITRLTIENFRSIKALELDLNETTVLIGPNNAEKTAILDAIRIVLTRRWGQQVPALQSMMSTSPMNMPTRKPLPASR